MLVKHTLKPIYNNNSKVLILGSMPSVKSREIGFYYAHSSNRFWPIMENLFNVKLNTIKEKEQFLYDKGIALWDVFGSVHINKSSDSSIKNTKLNDINSLIKNTQIKVIFCTGKTAYEHLIKQFNTNLPIIYLPSPSSANAQKSIQELVNDYNIILKYLDN